LALGASFRDPSGFVFRRDGVLLRQVNKVYETDFRTLLDSGLHDELVEAGLLIPAERLGTDLALTSDALDVLRPELVPFISYPYEWAFSQLKDAALATLDAMSIAFGAGMVLKDASAYNVQFLRGKPILIDTLSFERYVEGEPWIAYRQFCQHFLAPLALMAHADVRLSALTRTFIDGIPIDLASKLLPQSTWLKPGLTAHIRLHGRATAKPPGEASRPLRVSRTALSALLQSLRSTVVNLRWEPKGTRWVDYYGETNYTARAMARKRQMVSEYISAIEPQISTCWDLGANTGEFSNIAASAGVETVAFDFDPAAVEQAYLSVKAKRTGNVLPLLLDLTNPSPDQGWASAERDSLSRRGPADLVLALALVHHLAIGNNVPLPLVADFFASLCTWCIVEFVPKEDSQVRRMLAQRKDIFKHYDLDGFESAFFKRFDVVKREQIAGTDRTLYLLRVSRP
jgi:hypothetical protein